MVKYNGDDISDSIIATPRRPTPCWAWVVAAIVGAALGIGVGIASADELDQHDRHALTPPFETIEDVIRYHATSRGVRPEPLIALLRCESSLRADAVGDHGTSFGIAQLSALPTGLLSHFYAVGYSSPWDSEQAIEYVTRVAAGEFLPGQPGAPPLHPSGVVSLARWSCNR